MPPWSSRRSSEPLFSCRASTASRSSGRFGTRTGTSRVRSPGPSTSTSRPRRSSCSGLRSSAWSNVGNTIRGRSNIACGRPTCASTWTSRMMRGPCAKSSTSTWPTSTLCSRGFVTSGRRQSRRRWNTGSRQTTRNFGERSSTRWSERPREAWAISESSSRRSTATSGRCARRVWERTPRRESSRGPCATPWACIRTSPSAAASHDRWNRDRMTRLATGIQGFDAMVQGGLPVGSSVILQGPPGQEKLRFALTFLAEGLKSGGSGLVVISTQSPDAVLAELRGLGVNLDAVTTENRLRIVDWYSWTDETILDIEEEGIVVRSSIDLTNLGVALSRAIAALPSEQPRRAVIELLSPAMNAYEVTQVYAFAQSAKRKFDRHQFTSLVLLEKDMHSGPEITTLLQPFDGVIEVERTRSGDRILRKIGVLHLKDTTPDPTFQILEMTESGMRVLRETAKPSAAPGVGPTEGAVLESQEERARRLSLIMQIASERLKLNSKDTDALFAMAAAQATLDDPRGGLQALDRLAELDPTYPGLWVLKTKLHARLGEADRARQSRLRGQEIERPETSRPSQTVPCPMCEAPVADDATACGNCGVKFASVTKLEDELEDLGRAAVQDMVQEELREGLPPEATKPRPMDRETQIPRPTKPEMVSPPKPSPKPVPKKGLTNGLVLSRSARRRAGMTNGLKGRTNGLRGRTNGLTNGLGRTNGLTNGVGRTNGLTNGLGHTNGLTNGLGRTNGLTNGLGRTNGLTNGLGRTNGLAAGRATGFRSASLRGMMRTAGWKLYVIPLVVVLLLLMPLFFVPPYNGAQSPIQIDGQFNDWTGVATEAMASGGVLNPNVDIVRFGVVPNLGPIAFFVEVAGSALTGGGPSPGTMDTVRIFIDIDGSASTGYRIDGLGADRMIEVSGYAGRVQSSTLWEFDANRNQRDWNGWIKGTATPAAASGSRLEAEAQWLAGVAAAVPGVATR